MPVNWCPALGTVLANEEVVGGVSERGGHPVVRLPMKQWMLRITAYADRLLEGLDGLEWDENIKVRRRGGGERGDRSPCIRSRGEGGGRGETARGTKKTSEADGGEKY